MKLGFRAQIMKPSPTLALANRARELGAKGNPVISLTVGEPDWPTLSSASEAGIAAINQGQTKYTAAQGTPELRRALIPWLLEETGVNYSESEIAVSSGAKFILAASFQVLFGPGDEVIIPAPYWVSYPVMVDLAGAHPVIAECGVDSNYKLTAKILKSVITEKTKALILCSPSNPTGLVLSEQELREIGQVLKEHPNIILITDDIYTRLMLNGDVTAPHILKVCPELRDQVICVNGASKSFSMTGWRIGWAAGPAQFIKSLSDYLSQTTSNPSTISQLAVLGALKNGREEMKKNSLMLAERCAQGLRALESVPLLSVAKPEGAFYFWLDVRKWIGKRDPISKKTLTSSKEICESLLNNKFLATVPGEEFGAPGFLRASYAIGSETFLEAAARLKSFASELGST